MDSHAILTFNPLRSRRHLHPPACLLMNRDECHGLPGKRVCDKGVCRLVACGHDEGKRVKKKE